MGSTNRLSVPQSVHNFTTKLSTLASHKVYKFRCYLELKIWNQVLEQNTLENYKLLKTGSAQTHSKSKRKLVWVFIKN